MRIALVSLTIVAGGMLAGCKPQVTAAPAPAPSVLNFSYSPPNTARAGSAGVTLALVQPRWSQPGASGNILEFSTAMKNDFMALLNARGFTTRGPFDSYQAMVYPDKTGSDLVLAPELAMKMEFTDLREETSGGFLGALQDAVTLDGTATLRGRINLVLSESMTNERMWSKSIAVDPIIVQWTGTKRYKKGGAGRPAEQPRSGAELHHG